MTRSVSTPLLIALYGKLVHRRITPSIKFASSHLYTQVEKDTVRVKCIAQEHNNIPNGTLTGVKHIDTSDTVFFTQEWDKYLNKFYKKSHMGTEKENVQRHRISKMRLTTLQQQKLDHTTTMTQVDVHHSEHYRQRTY